jgi:hypothetical protein
MKRLLSVALLALVAISSQGFAKDPTQNKSTGLNPQTVETDSEKIEEFLPSPKPFN